MPVHDGAVDLAGELSPSLRPGGPPAFGREAPPAFGREAPPAFGREAPPAFGREAPQPSAGRPPSRIRRAETPLRLSSEWIEIVTNIGAGRAAPTVTFED